MLAGDSICRYFLVGQFVKTEGPQPTMIDPEARIVEEQNVQRWGIEQPKSTESLKSVGLKHVANDNAEVRELIVAIVRNRESVLGEERGENPAVEEEPVVQVYEDARAQMMLRARTLNQIVAEIGTARSRRMERAMQSAEERRHMASGSGDTDEELGSGLEILTTENGKRVWFGDTTATGADGLQK